MSDEKPTLGTSRSAVLHDVVLTIRRCHDASDCEADLVAAARLLCEDTRRRSLPVERAIVDLKAALLADAADLTPGDSLSAIRDRVIQMTIEEYYRPEGRPPA